VAPGKGRRVNPARGVNQPEGRISSKIDLKVATSLKGALQLLINRQRLINRHRLIRFAHVHERVSTQRFVGLIIGHSKSNRVGAQGTFKVICTFASRCRHICATERVNPGLTSPSGSG